MRKVVFDIETRNDFGNSSFDPAKLDISMVCVYDSGTGTYDSFLEGELSRLWPIIEQADMLIGYNSDHFDIPLLNKYYPGDLSRIRSLDRMKEVYNSLGRRLKLDTIAEGTLGEKKSADGIQSLRWWKAGEIEKVREYCLKDVALTKKVLEYALLNGSIKYRDFGKLREVKLDTTHWLSGGSKPLTRTLGF